jgi:hypothetical protein
VGFSHIILWQEDSWSSTIIWDVRECVTFTTFEECFDVGDGFACWVFFVWVVLVDEAFEVS